jgi:hypothetical protein
VSRSGVENGRHALSEVGESQAEAEPNEKTSCIIRGRVTYARGAVPLANVTARLLSATTGSKPQQQSKTTRTGPATDAQLEGGVASTVQTQSTTTETGPVAEVQSTGETEPAPQTRSTTTDIAGAYQLLNLEAGTYEVSVTPPKDWKYETKAQTFDLAPGEVKEANFRLEKIVLETILDGRVFDGDGKPAKGARLEGVLCGTNLESVVAGNDGRFVFKNVTPGSRFVRVMYSGHLGEVRDFDIEEGQTISLDIALKKAAHRIYGTVTNELGEPFGATVRLYEKGVISQKCETTKENGSYEFYVNEGEWSVLAQASLYHFEAWAGLVSADVKHDFQLRPIRPGEAGREEDRAPM